MDRLEPKNLSEVTDVDDASEFNAFLADVGRGLRFVPEPYESVDNRVLKSDIGDFAKWLRCNHPELMVEVPQAERLVLRSSDLWLPLVFLASDVSLPIYLNLVSSYLYERLKGALRRDNPRVHLSAEYIDGESGSIRKFTFEGDHETLKATMKKFDLNEFMNGQ